MLDILVTVGVILVLIALVALMLHLTNAHQEQRVATARYERFHPGDPRSGPSEEREGRLEGGRTPDSAEGGDRAEAQHPPSRPDPNRGPDAAA